jgi:hypothetical protein
LRRRHQIEQFRWQAFGRLDVDAERADVTRRRDRRDRHASIVGERADHVPWPDRRARSGSRYRALGMAQARQELAGDDAGSAAGTPHFHDTCGERGDFVPQ